MAIGWHIEPLSLLGGGMGLGFVWGAGEKRECSPGSVRESTSCLLEPAVGLALKIQSSEHEGRDLWWIWVSLWRRLHP